MTIRRTTVLALLAALLTAALLTGATPPGSAATRSQAVESGDAPAAIDITRLTVHNRDRRAVMQFTVRALGRRGVFDFHYWRGGTQTPPPQSLIVTVRRAAGVTTVKLFACGLEDCVPAACPGLRAEWRRGADVVRASLPQRCYPRPDGTAPPTVGRFFGGSRLGSASDATSAPPLRVKRG